MISAGPLARIAEVIQPRFRVDYTLAGLDLLLHRLGWSVQVPLRKAAERDEARICAWQQEQAGREKGAADLGAWVWIADR